MNERRLTIQNLMDISGVRFGTSGARGLVSAMDDALCFAFAAAFLKVIGARGGRIALAVDLRPSSPAIAAACAAAIEQAGCVVDYCGALPTPALAYYAQNEGVPAIMVTGSHIPFDRNGIKFYGVGGEITKADEAAISACELAMPADALTTALPPVNRSAYALYVERHLQFFPPRCLAGMHLGFYEHSSVARDLLTDLLQRLGAEVTSLGRTDQFVPIDTEAVSAADVEQARLWAAENSFDALLSTDGDGDRPLLGDENGRWFRGDLVGVLCAQYLGAQGVVTTVSANTAVEACGSFPQVLRTRIGSPYVIAGIEQLIADGTPAVVGFEPNGGFLVGSSLAKDGRMLPALMTRDAVLPILCLLSMARERGCAVSALLDGLPPRFTASDRLQDFPTEISRALIARFAAEKSAAESLLAGLAGKVLGQDETDGLRLILEKDEVVHFRPSGNAPELRCYAEAASQARAEQLVRDCLQRLRARLAAEKH